jgi:YggT family protein
MNAALFFVIKTLLDLYLIAYILRFLLQWSRADFHNPLSQFILRITDPVVRPLRRWCPAGAASTLPAGGPAAAAAGGHRGPVLHGHRQRHRHRAAPLLRRAAHRVGVIRLYFFAILVHVILSWVNPGHWSPLTSVLHSLTEPVLRPVRRLIPPIAGLDLSPLFVLIGLQALLILIRLPGYLA